MPPIALPSTLQAHALTREAGGGVFASVGFMSIPFALMAIGSTVDTLIILSSVDVASLTSIVANSIAKNFAGFPPFPLALPLRLKKCHRVWL
jgi:hypothetical protein